ncbi:MAG: phosphoribosylformylglycinamidine synthase, partial [Oscillospiraceae bacterium]|nr:phosphoribosylformylglycinamidine synthase [Oscillospiraceae bacterium]
MVYRAYSIKRPGFDIEAGHLLADLRENLGISSLDSVTIANRYDIEGIDEATFFTSLRGVISEPNADFVYIEELDSEVTGSARILLAEALPGQFDQRADSCAACIQAITAGIRPEVAYAKVYILRGRLNDTEFARIRSYLINPVDSREASPDKPVTLVKPAPDIASESYINGFIDADDSALETIRRDYALAMDFADLKFMQTYFRDTERRDPSVTEFRVIDTYWSDHCRHTTFLTQLDNVKIDDPDVLSAWERYIALREEIGDKKPVSLMDIGTIGAKVLKKRGGLTNLDESEEINACSIRVKARFPDGDQDWLLMFKNETHNHPTEIEPFGGAATCIGGAIRDPLSGRAYVYQAMRVTGSADPRVPASETIPGKLPRKKLTTTAAVGYSSYGNQIGLATGLVTEIYHPGYEAKRMEIGAVVGAAPLENIRRERPSPGDKVILLGGRTGRDGIGGATGSSKAHDADTTEKNGAEVQKGNAPEERKLQRLFRNSDAARLIKRCNDFGAGGVSVAIGELADGLNINLDKVPKKYAGLNGTELAISESQERMAVVVSASDAGKFTALANAENLEATIVAEVTAEPRMVMSFQGETIVNLSREFLDSNGAPKFASAYVGKLPKLAPYVTTEPLPQLAEQIYFASQRNLQEHFDSSIGAGSVLLPYGGKYQRTPSQVMAALLPSVNYDCETASAMSFAFDPYDSFANPYKAAYSAVILSVAKLVAAGCDYREAYLSFQEYFERLRNDPERWGKPLAALLGALDAQVELGIAAIGGKDSMSGSYEDMDVPPTLVSFAIAPCLAEHVISSEFKAAGHNVYLLGRNDWSYVTEQIANGNIIAARAVE